MFSVIFPGQGSQTIGMGKEFFDKFELVKELFKEADNILNIPLSKIILEGPKNDLDLTINTQPAIFLISYSIYNVIKEEFNIDLSKAKYFAGHSLGEYSALSCSGYLNFSDTLKLLRARGDAMQNAVPKGEGGMLAVLGSTIDKIEKILKENKEKFKTEIANDNSEGQLVLSGKNNEIDKLTEVLKLNNIKNIRLPVSAPFHCQLMNKATEIMKNEIEKVNFQDSKNILISNVTGEEILNKDQLKILLIQQIENRVRWRESVINMINKGINHFIEIGPGKVLSGLVKRINKDVKINTINSESDIKDLKNMSDLKDKNIIVTGASGGIGNSIVKKLCEKGANILASGTKLEKLEKLKSENKNIKILKFDISEIEKIDQFIEDASSELGGNLDCLINNAGITQDNLAIRMTLEEWKKVIDINLTSTFLMSKSAIKKMLKNKSGKIINITSVVGHTGNLGQANYTASKAGIIAMSKSLAIEYAKKNININCISPGFIKTAMTDKIDEKFKEIIISKIPSARLGEPEDIANAVLFLASDQSNYINGETLHVNGGMYMA